MKFTLLTIHNFLSIGDSEVNLADRGLVLIEGKNLDDPSARSNGAGKSSIVDALSFVLYGKTARGVSGDDVINRKAKKDCSVSVTIETSTEQYVITRGRKTSMGNVLFVEQKDLDDGLCSKDLTKGTMAETQTVIENIVGCPHEVFVAAVYAGQDAMPDLPAMTDKQLKQLIESVIGVERISNIYQKVLKKHNELLSEKTMLTGRIDLLNDYCESINTRIKEAVQREENARINQELHIKEIEDGVSETAETILTAKARYEQEFNEENLAKLRNAEFEKRIAKAEKEQIALLAKSGEVLNAENALTNANNEFMRLKNDALKLAKDVQNINSRVGTTCSECGKTYTEADLVDAKRAAVANLKMAVDDAKRAESALEPLMQALKEKQQQLKLMSEKKTSTADIAREKAENDQFLLQRQRDLMEIKNREDVLKRLKKELVELKKPIDTSFSEGLRDSLKQKEEERTVLTDKINVLSKQIEASEICKDIFGPQGVRQHILDTITPTLNDRTARYLDVLSDGKLSAVWTTLTRTKKGEVKEKFNIEVKNNVGGGSFESLSGGEKRKVRVACCLALQELVASRATKPIELFIADEVDHALDEAGVERLIGVLNEKASICKSLFVISHNPLRNWIDNTITVVKKDGFSTIE